MRKRLSDRVIKALKPGAKEQEIHDTDTRGLLVRMQRQRADGTASVAFEFKLDRTKRIKLGRWPDMTLSRARTLALEVAQAQTAGRDPRAVVRPKASGVLTLGDFLDDDPAHDEQRYGYWVKVHRKTGAATLARLKACYRDHLDRALTDITPAFVDRWRTTRTEAGRRPETINRDVGALRAALSKAVEWGYIDANPIGRVKPVKVDRKRQAQRALTVDEEAALLAALEAREGTKREGRASGNRWREERGQALLPSLEGRYVDALQPAVVLSLNTGLRRGELFALIWADIDLEAKKITIRGATAKAGITRTVVLNSAAAAVLRGWRLQSGKAVGLVFPGMTGSGLGNLKKSYHRVLAAAGVDRDNGRGRVTWHSLRHTFGTRLASAGVPAPTVQRLMGHASISTTARYFHVEEDQQREAVEALVR